VRWKWVVRLLILALVAVLVVRYIGRLDAHAILAAATGANLPLLVVATLGNVPLVWCKARRMRRLCGGRVGTGRLMRLYFASYAADNLVMSQAGLGVRVAALRADGIAVSTAAAAQAIEKALEALGLALTVAPILLTHRLEAWILTPLSVCSAVAAAMLAAAILLAPRIHHPLAERIAHAAVELRRPLGGLEVLALTVGAWLIEGAMVMITLRALHLDVPPLLASALVLLAVNMAALVPGLPANVGPFEISAVLALRAVGVGAPGVGFAVLYHACHTIPVTAVGLIVGRRASYAPSLSPSAVETSTSTTSGR
jgi:uncharacterized membrane protein YbhN (UPF0104 family)